MISVKICGLTDENAVRAVIAAGADYAGFVYFPKSPRHIAPEHAARLKSLLPPSIRSVSVTVDPDDALLERICALLQPDYIQLHGHESAERVRAIKATFPDTKIIKAIAVRTSDDIAHASHYYDCADMLLFDAKAPTYSLSLRERARVRDYPPVPNSLNLPHPNPLPEGEGVYLPGGNGLAFDWALLKNREFPLPWFLSGGLSAQNVGDAIRQTGAKLVDVSSGVERIPGVKDPALIEAFVKIAKQ